MTTATRGHRLTRTVVISCSRGRPVSLKHVTHKEVIHVLIYQ